MKLCFMNHAKWIFTLQVAISIHEIFAQRGDKPTLQDLLTLCNDYEILNCQWLHQNSWNDLIVTPKDVEDIKLVEYRNHLNPKIASIHDQRNSAFPFPFARTWKGQSGQLAWNEGDKIEDEKLQFGTPFNYDTKRDANSFSSWGGKRGRIVREDTSNGKRQTAFSNWGGKRTQKFFNWGGKRNIDANRITEQIPDNSEHNIMKRSAVDISRQNEPREKQICTTNEMSVEELYKDFMDWSRKQPDHNKGSINRKMFGISVLRGSDNLSRRADSFFQWGGKRSTKND